MARNTMTRAAFLRERSREMRIARSRRVAYVAGRVVSVNNNVVMVERPTGRVVPISVRYVPAYRRVTRGSFVTLPVTYTRGNYFAYLPGVTQTYAPQYPPYQYYGMAAASPMYYDPYYYAQTAQPVAFAAPNVPDCSQPYYGDNPNQYYFTVQQYDDYCGYGNVAYYNDAGYYNGPYYDNAPYGNAPYGNSGYYGPYDGSYSPNLAGYGVPAGGVFNPYLSAANTALVSGIIVGRSGSNLIVLTDNFQPAIVNVSEAQAFGNTGSSLDVGRPIVAAGFYDPTNTLVATAIQ